MVGFSEGHIEMFAYTHNLGNNKPQKILNFDKDGLFTMSMTFVERTRNQAQSFLAIHYSQREGLDAEVEQSKQEDSYDDEEEGEAEQEEAKKAVAKVQ